VIAHDGATPKPPLLPPSAALAKAMEEGYRYRAVRITDVRRVSSRWDSPKSIGSSDWGQNDRSGPSRRRRIFGAWTAGLAGSRDRSGTMLAVVAIGESADRQVKSAADLQPTSLKA
jgi:hypothetical protein